MDEDHKNMIAAARRMARRIARSTATSYQTQLDAVARRLGREHWAAFMADPVAVPRETPREQADRTGLCVNNGRGVTLPESLVRELARMNQAYADEADRPKTTLYNALSSAAAMEPGRERSDQIEQISDILMDGVSNAREGRYFDERGRMALRAFIHWEIGKAGRAGREPSFTAMMDGIRTGFDTSRLNAPTSDDRIGDWIRTTLEDIDDASARRDMRDVADCQWKERNAILGTMDRALMAFRRPVPSSPTSE